MRDRAYREITEGNKNKRLKFSRLFHCMWSIALYGAGRIHTHRIDNMQAANKLSNFINSVSIG